MAAINLDRWREAAAANSDPEAAIGPALTQDPAASTILAGLFGNSPFLTQCALRQPGIVCRTLTKGPDDAFAASLQALHEAVAADEGDERFKRALRIARTRAALVIALADITGVWTVEQVTNALSQFAEEVLTLAVRHLLRQAAAKGRLSVADPEKPEVDSGLIILAMGKLGSGELNYSSDIDLIVLFDVERAPVGGGEVRDFFVRLTRNLVQLVEQRTADGYVFRVDLRLRPDPSSTPPALSTDAAIAYYESVGQNWERAAMIKARPVAGDIAAGNAFLRAIEPFIWRKHLDFAAIQDIHSIKRQIHRHKGGDRIAVAGHNLKIGRGGIREIEFFAQTQQLIWGGRYPSLRCRPTIDALRALQALERIDDDTETDLAEAYRFLRRAEHRLQMINDAQTHTLPDTDAGVRQFATFLGYAEPEQFLVDLTGHLKRVDSHYGELFRESPALTAPMPEGGSLSFTGADDDPDTLETMARLGFREPAKVSALIRGWHHGRARASRSARARELLTELVPPLLAAFGRTANPDAAFARFGDFLGRLPAGVQVLSLLLANPRLLDLVAEIMGTAPRLAETLSRNPGLLDAVLTREFFDPLPEAEALADDLDDLLSKAIDFQDFLGLARRWTHDAEFRVGVHLLRGIVPPKNVERQLSDVADVVLAALQKRVEAEFAEQHGIFAGGGMAVVGLGKLGSRELSFASDLDLVFVFENPRALDQSDGPKPLTPGRYFAQLSQRLITAVTALMREGRLYEIDTRLRPHGNAGPITIDIEGYERYYHEDAWVWEQMALTRARVVTGPDSLRRRIERVIEETVTRRRDPWDLYPAVSDMRKRIAATHGTDDPWDVKQVRGGLVDIGFIAQALQLARSAEHPEIRATNTIVSLLKLGEAGLLGADETEDLVAAARLQRNVQDLLRLCVAGRFVEKQAPSGLRDVLVRVAGMDDFAAVKDALVSRQRRVCELYSRLIEEKADASADKGAEP